MIKALLWCFRLLDRRQRREFWLIATLASFAALMELLGIAAVIPALSVLVDRSSAARSPRLQWLFRVMGEPDLRTFAAQLTLGAIVLVIVSSLITLAFTLANRRFLKTISANLATRVYEYHLKQPIEVFLAKPAAEFLRNVNGVSERIATGVIGASVTLVGKSFQIAVIVSVLVLVSPAISALLITVICGSYLLIYLLFKQRLAQMTLRSFAEVKTIQQLVLGSYQAFRSIVVDQRISGLVRHFRQLKSSAARTVADTEFIGTAPRQVIEVVGIGSLVLTAFLVGQSARSSHHFVSLMALFGVAAYRILTAAQQVYQAGNRISGALVVCGEIREAWGDLETAEPAPANMRRLESLAQRPSRIELHSVAYSYGSRKLFRDLDLSFELSGIVRIAGSSGVGKTTLLEILAGLRRPESGEVLVDGEQLSAFDPRDWWSRISYLSQSDYLFEGTLGQNITQLRATVDERRLELVGRICGLDNLGLGPATMSQERIAEAGAGLSGGQRSRVLLARALYKSSSLLLLDEAFAALDVDSARAIIAGIRQYFPERCLVLVSHREAELPGEVAVVNLPVTTD